MGDYLGPTQSEGSHLGEVPDTWDNGEDRDAPFFPEERSFPSRGQGWVRLGAAMNTWFDQLQAEQTAQEKPTATHSATSRIYPSSDTCPTCCGERYLVWGQPQHSELIPCPDCEQPRLDTRAEQSHLRWTNWAAIAGQTFETLGRFGSGPAGEVYRAAMAFATEPRGWFILAGSSQRQQTHLAAAIANEVKGRFPQAIYLTAQSLLELLKEAVSNQGNQSPSSGEEVLTVDRIMTTVCDCFLLVLTDLDRVRLSPWARERLFLVINHRYNYKSPTAITLTNENSIETRTLSRMMDRQLLYRGRAFCLGKAPADGRGRRNIRVLSPGD